MNNLSSQIDSFAFSTKNNRGRTRLKFMTELHHLKILCLSQKLGVVKMVMTFPNYLLKLIITKIL